MSRYVIIGVLASLFFVVGCTRIVKMEPTSGPPGTPVYVRYNGTYGDPACHCLKWDNKKICDPFCGSFIVPAVNNGGHAGKHKVTVVDKLDASEAFLVFPILRLRESSATFTVTEP